MATLNPNTVVTGTCYIIKIKKSRHEYDADDLMYVVANKGQGNFGFGRFKTLCEENNGMFCLAHKLHNGNGLTWEDCKESVEDLPPKGNPFLLIERAYTLAEVGAIAYDKNIFSDAKGLKSLGRLTKPPKSSKVVKVKKEKGAGEVNTSLTIAQAQQQAMQLMNIQKTVGLPNMGNGSQADSLLTNRVSVPEAGEFVTVLDSGDDDDHSSSGKKDYGGGEGKGRSGLDDVIEDRSMEAWKEMALREKCLEEENKQLKDRLGSVSAKLKASEEMCVKYMAQLDIKDAAFKVVTDEISDKVVAKLSPKLESISATKKAAVDTLDLVKAMDIPLGKLPTVLGAVKNRMESNFDALSEGVTRVQDALDNFGITEGEESVDIPEAVRYVFDVTRQHAQTFGTPVRDEQVSEICFYKANGIRNVVLVCKCGCALEVTGAFHGHEGDFEDEKHADEEPVGHEAIEPLERKETTRPLSSPSQKLSECPTPVVKRGSGSFEPDRPKKNRRNRSAKTKFSNQAAQLASMKSDTTDRGPSSSSWVRGADVRDGAGSGGPRQDLPGQSMKYGTAGRGTPSDSWGRGTGAGSWERGDVAGSCGSRQDQPGHSHHLPRALFKPTGGNMNIKVWVNDPPSK